QYRLNHMAMDVTDAIVLPPLPADTKFTVSSELLQMLQNRGLFTGLPSEDPHHHLQNVVFVCKSVMGTQNLSLDVVGLRVFPLSLTSNTAVWLFELPPGTITSWAELQRVFLERYFPRSKKLKLKDQINNFEQLPGDSISTTWEQFTKCLRSIPNHKIVDDALVEIFYHALNKAYMLIPSWGAYF
ncbi:retrotransposon gag domain-containing protein, partial [Corynebacterium parakroppenstedtii]|uniref:retrotransposon gag domain-containing protein n=1 Tax=Corynebacterium parakroppenstedtii TaxID=2828363 RepID=UPI001F3DCD4F